ncbi:MAG: M56 family metallopeptidase [Bryobacteraceae bacterium]
MNPAPFLAEWAVRSSILIVGGTLLLHVLRVKDAPVRLAAFLAILFGSLSIPAVIAAFPKVVFVVMPATPSAPLVPPSMRESTMVTESGLAAIPAASSFDWTIAALVIYGLVAAAFLLRLGVGLWLTRGLLRSSRATRIATEGVEVRTSDRVTAPVTIGIFRSTIVLPVDWEEWDRAKLDAVLAHEVSHVRRWDPAVQLVSAIHRALLWHSPLSWFLHRRIVQLAEEASDDAAVMVTRDRASYAEVLLDFMQRGVRGARWHGVAMARYGRPDDRIHRILDGATISTGLTRAKLAAILSIALPVAYLTATAYPSRAAQAGAAVAQAPAKAAKQQSATASQTPEPSKKVRVSSVRRYRIFLGDTQSGQWDSDDPVDDEALHARFGRRFAWFRQAGNAYVITDNGVLAEIEKAMEPQKRVNEMQDRVNQLQNAVNQMQEKMNGQQNNVSGLQDKVNELQNEVNRLQAEANRIQEIRNRIADSSDKEGKDALIRKMEAAIQELRKSRETVDQDAVNRQQGLVNAEQSRVNEAQHRMNEAQGHVNVEQEKVNREQQKVNVEQTGVSARFSARIQEIFDSALRNGQAKIAN